jgi:putative selenate reductase
LDGALHSRVNRLESSLVETAGLLNTAPIVEQETGDPRYAAKHNRAVPRKIGSHLLLYDCINCDKCVPVCPNDANFIYETAPVEAPYHDYRIEGGQLQELPGGTLRIDKAHQIANYADFCNDCGHCDMHCPEEGGPYLEKPRFFGSLETYRAAGRQGFYVEYGENVRTIYGTLGGASYRVVVEDGLACFDDGVVEADVDQTLRILSWRAKPGHDAEGHVIGLSPYLQLNYLLQAVSDPRRINYVNVPVTGRF